MATTRSEPPTTALDGAPVAAHHLVHSIAMAGIAVTVSLSIADALAGLFVPGASHAGLIASALALPLHVRHLWFGIRGQRPPAGAWTLTALALISVGGAWFAGGGWLGKLSLLSVSTLIVVPGITGYVLASAVIAAPLFILGTQWYVGRSLGGWYVTSAILWRTVTQIVLLRLVAGIRALDSASKELEARALVQARLRIDNVLRNGIGATLQRIIASGERALVGLDAAPDRARDELRQLVRESRRGLSDARRVVGQYRCSSLRAELDTASALLEASGTSVRVVMSDGVTLDTASPEAQRAVRAALTEALLAGPCAEYVLYVTRHDDAGVIVRGMPAAVAEERR